MEKSASNIIVKSSNSDENGNDPCKTRRKRLGLLHGNHSKAQTIQVAGFHRRLASTNFFLSLSLFLLSRRSTLFFLSSIVLSLSLYRFPTLASDTFSPLHRFCFFSGLPHCIQSGSTKLETAALSALLRLLLSVGFALFVAFRCFFYL